MKNIYEYCTFAVRVLALLACVFATSTTDAATNTWDGTSGNWTDGTKWSVGLPQAGDDVVINGGSVLLSINTADLFSLTMDGGTLIFTNWTTSLNATNVTLNSGAKLTLPAVFKESQMSNRVYIVCSNFTLNSGATIDAATLGFSGGSSSGVDGEGPGKGLATVHYGGGAGYGGAGADGTQGSGGPACGLIYAPILPGSGGGGNLAGHGGGAVRIAASGNVKIDGTIDTTGGNMRSGYGGGGSGGGIFISCNTFQGAASGALIATGGNGRYSSDTSAAGGGGGGRIAVAIGMSDSDIQKLINNQAVSNLAAALSYPGYAGDFSVTNGWSIDSLNLPITRPGEMGTVRFLQISSSPTHTLVVDGSPYEYGTPAPYPYGTYPDTPNGVITNTVSSPIDQGSGLRKTCVNWSVTNALGVTMTNGSGNQAVFDMTTNLVLTYTWTNMYQLSVTSAIPAQGSVNSTTVDGWYTNGTVASGITALPTTGYVFNYWTGTGVPIDQQTNNPLSVTMTAYCSPVAHFSVEGGVTKTWSGTGSWTETGNWTPVGIPGSQDNAYIASGTVTVSEPVLTGSLVVSNGTTMVFTNWNAKLTASSNITIDGEVTLSLDFTEAEMSNRVYFACSDFTLSSGGIIDVAGLGFSGGWSGTYANGEGPGKGLASGGYYGGGAGYGGAGADGSHGAGGSIYGVTNAPLLPGSGGGGEKAGCGGGAVRIDASGAVRIDGTIDASGSDHIGRGAGGSGGGIFISCDTFQGAASGNMIADGGDGKFYASSTRAGGGGGGRIAVAIGMSTSDLQKLIDNQSVSNLIVTESYVNYAGGLSVTNGWSEKDGVPQEQPGEMGTVRFLQIADPTAHTLVIKGYPDDYGVPVPYAYGNYPNLPDGLRITNTVATPFDVGDGLGWGCIGWSVTNALGVIVTNGSGNQAVFDLTTNLVLTFNWTNMYQLGVTSAIPAQGSVNAETVNGFYENETVASGITASPAAGYVFNYWTGTGVPAGQETNNPLSVTMTAPCSPVAHFSVDGGETKTWNGTGNWTETGNWTPIGIPGYQDNAYIASGTVTVSEAVLAGSLVVSNGTTMVFTNWNAKLTASSTITIDGEVTLPSAFTEADMSNRVYFACSDFTLSGGGSINVAGLGFSGGYSIDNGEGPGKGLASGGYYGGGAGYGGAGGNGQHGLGGATYGAINAPASPGSGGGGEKAGCGGGAVRIDASDAVVIDGTIDASGSDHIGRGAGGSGGGIFISCDTFRGAASGALIADGGDGKYYSDATSAGGGGGGRIAVVIGMGPENYQKIINNQPIDDLAITESYPDYAGGMSVTNGWSVDGNNIPQVRPGEMGTARFLWITRPQGAQILLN